MGDTNLIQLPGPLAQLDLAELWSHYDIYEDSLQEALMNEQQVKDYNQTFNKAISLVESATAVYQLSQDNKINNNATVTHKLVTFLVSNKYYLHHFNWLSPTIQRRIATKMINSNRAGLLLQSIMLWSTGKLLVGSLYQHLVVSELVVNIDKTYNCYLIKELEVDPKIETRVEELAVEESKRPEVEETKELTAKMKKVKKSKEATNKTNETKKPLEEKVITYQVDQDSKFQVHFPPISTGVHLLQDDMFNKVLISK
jgi:hypothetical protein